MENVSAIRESALALQAEAQTAANTVLENRDQAAAILEAVQSAPAKCAEAENLANTTAAAIVENAAAVAIKSEHIEKGRAHADEVRVQLDVSLVQAQQSAATAATQVETGQAAITNIAEIRAAAQETKGAIDSVGEAVASLRSQCEAHVATTKRLADTTDELEARIKASVSNLAELQKSSEERLKVIENLLAGATTAGLAQAFDKRSKTFKLPERVWQWVFIGSLGALFDRFQWS